MLINPGRIRRSASSRGRHGRRGVPVGRVGVPSPAVSAGRHPETFPERAVERSDGAVTRLQGDGEDGQAGLSWIPQPLCSLAQSVLMQKIIEVAKPQPAIDDPSENVLLGSEQAGQGADRQALTRIQAFAPMHRWTPRYAQDVEALIGLFFALLPERAILVD
jgi:hypothetical protein